MAELSTQQKNVYNKLISNGLDEKTAEGLVTGAIDKDTYLSELQTKQKPQTKKEILASQGYDYDLIQSTTSKIKKDRSTYDELYMEGVDEALAYYMPSKGETFNLYGVRTDKEAPADVRYRLSFGGKTPDAQIFGAKRLLAEDLVQNQGLDKELVDQYKDKIKVKNQQVGEGNDAYTGLVFSIPKELGGDGYFYTFNKPGFDTSDLQGFAGDAMVIGASITAGTVGSAFGPGGTVAGSGLAAAGAEYYRLQLGRKYGLFDYMDDEQFGAYAFKEAATTGAIDAVATAAFLPLAKIIKQQVFMVGNERLSRDTVGKFLKTGGSIDEEMTKAINEARTVLKNAGVSDDIANDYIAISVANMIPESGIIPKGTKGDRIYKKILNSANERVKNKEVENKILKYTTGLDDINVKTSDNIINNIEKNVKNIREDELVASDKGVKQAFANTQRVKDNLYKTYETNQIDKMGIVFNEVNERLNSRLSLLQNRINTSAKKNQLTVQLDEKGTQVLKNIFNEYDLTIKKKISPTPPKGKKALAEWKNQKTINEFVDFLEQNGGQFGLVKDQLKILKEGVNSIDNLSFNNALAIKRALQNIDITDAVPKGTKDAIRNLKGIFNDAIDDAVSKDPKTAALYREYDTLLFNYKNSFLNKLADEIGYGPKPQVIRSASLTGTGRNVFDSITASTKEGLNNAERLGNLIDGKFLNFNQTNKIKGSLYQHYYDNVLPKEAGASGAMSHANFIKKYGDNYRLILGDDLYNKFAKDTGSAMKLYDDLVKQNADIQNIVSKELPSLKIDLLDKGTGTAIADEIFRIGNKYDIKPLIKKLSLTSNQLTTDIRKLYLQKMMNAVKTPIEGTNVKALNGNLLDDFLTSNKGVLDNLYGKEFVESYRSISKVLKLVQAPDLGGKAGEGLTEAANRAGLFIDIFAGPLNHKRLIVNRLGRIYDGMDLGGDSLDLLADYTKFTQAVKNQFLAGNYPRWLDRLGESSKPEHKNLFKKVLQAAQDYLPRKTYSFKTNPLYAKEYMEDKITERVSGEDVPPGSPDIFTPIDSVVNAVVGKTGATAPKYLDKYLTPKIKKLINMFIKGEKAKNINLEQMEFEKKLKKD